MTQKFKQMIVMPMSMYFTKCMAIGPVDNGGDSVCSRLSAKQALPERGDKEDSGPTGSTSQGSVRRLLK